MMPDTMDDPFNMEAVTKLAAKAADKASSQHVAPTDRGIHRTQEDIWEEELIAAGWKPVALHPHSPVWISPHDGLKYPGLGACWRLMKGKQNG